MQNFTIMGNYNSLCGGYKGQDNWSLEGNADTIKKAYKLNADEKSMSTKSPSEFSFRYGDAFPQKSSCDDTSSIRSCDHCSALHDVAFPHEVTAEEQYRSGPVTLIIICENCLASALSNRSSVLATPVEEEHNNTAPNQ